ncbi:MULTISPECIES: NUDIX hydrolase [Streptomyces]|uniref:NUDIX hydrolase n=1 Tax=Streptomyces TaxID=1883 RepID=UPI0022493DEB|nr:NUDIX hydrolase [Streptomyces sp. JHD 1]MCX2969814.1 NUDIX hydrolase [Streptomyces sp. JHD 1]
MPPPTPEPPVRAAGCVLWRPAPGGAAGTGVEIALVHRPRWADWSHPKGKLHPGESAAAAAVREVTEETGMHCALGPRLPTARYRTGERWKTVDYWLAQACHGAFAPSREIDRMTWLPPARARLLLTHPRDRTLLTTALLHLRAAPHRAP